MQIYESLDISIHDLEREKHQLTIESSVNKKQIKEWVKALRVAFKLTIKNIS